MIRDLAFFVINRKPEARLTGLWNNLLALLMCKRCLNPLRLELSFSCMSQIKAMILSKRLDDFSKSENMIAGLKTFSFQS